MGDKKRCTWCNLKNPIYILNITIASGVFRFNEIFRKN